MHPALAEYVSANEDARGRLIALVGALTEGDLRTHVEHDWTVSATLAHLAYWDRRYTLMLHRAVADQFEPPGLPEWFTDVENAALKVEWNALPAREAVRLALEAAKAIDAMIASLDENVAASIVQRGHTWLLDRSRHRHEHLDQIEAAIRG